MADRIEVGFKKGIRDSLGEKIRKMVKKLLSHKIWVDRGNKISDAFGQTRPDFFKKFFEQGLIGEDKILEQPINVQFISSGIWDTP